ncbi:MAG TPA: ribonuclease Y [Desulfobacteraceae bacterium]|nr:ribonuclease Y [Desulfobacteraceae bacterium]
MIETVLFITMGVAIGFVCSNFVKVRYLSDKIKMAEMQYDQILQDAERRAESILREADIEVKDNFFKMRTEFDTETKDALLELKRKEKWLVQKEETVDRKSDQIDRRSRETSKREKYLSKREIDIKRSENECKGLLEEQRKHLEKISGLTAEQAKELLVRTMENEARHEGAKRIKKIANEVKEKSDIKAKEIMATAIQRYAGDFIVESAVSVVQLPNDDMKGRIIGREGRNIRALEAATGIDLIVDDTPEAVIMSGFNPVRREIARLSLIKLISDGRIHPARIEDVVKKVGKEVELTIKEAGEQAVFDLGVHDVHQELVKYIGSLKFRTSYAQNVLQHSVEVGFICGIMASELSLDQKLAKRMGLFHDIGKAIDHEVEGSHALIGADIAKKFGENEQVVHAIAAHHEDVAPNSVYALLVQAADCLSGARPGARKELLESYIKRLENLEDIANSYKGVESSYAIQAGRELRVIVKSDMISDEDALLVSRDIVKKIESTLTFPGQIKVVVIRETRSVEYANK